MIDNPFSEDIGLFLNKKAFDPPLGESKADKTLKTFSDILLIEVIV